MEFAAIVFVSLGVMLVGFGLLSLGNVFNIGITQHQRDHADISKASFRLTLARFILVGFALVGIGALCAVLA